MCENFLFKWVNVFVWGLPIVNLGLCYWFLANQTRREKKLKLSGHDEP